MEEYARWLETDHREQLEVLRQQQAEAMRAAQTELEKKIQYIHQLQDTIEKGEKRISAVEAELTDHRHEIAALLSGQQEARQQVEQARAVLDEQQRMVSEVKQLQTDAEFLQSIYAQLSAAFNEVMQSFGGMMTDFNLYGKNAEVFVKKFQNRLQSNLESKELWQHIESRINETRSGELGEFFAAHPDLSDKERQLVMLLVLGFDSASIAVCLGYSGPRVIAVMSRFFLGFIFACIVGNE